MREKDFFETGKLCVCVEKGSSRKNSKLEMEIKKRKVKKQDQVKNSLLTFVLRSLYAYRCWTPCTFKQCDSNEHL